jgi:hypothetical protein
VVEPKVVIVTYPARWEKPRIDLDELAKLRKAGWQTSKLAAHFGVGLSAIKMAFARHRHAVSAISARAGQNTSIPLGGLSPDRETPKR